MNPLVFLLGAPRKRTDALAKNQGLKGVLRAGAYLGFVAVILGGLTLRHAKAEVAKSSLDFGREIAKLGAPQIEGATQVRLNGESLFLSNEDTPDAVSAVLDRFETHCRENNGVLGDLWKEIAKEQSKAPDKTLGAQLAAVNPLEMGVLRTEKDGEGVVLCFVKGSDTPRSFREAVADIKRTGNLGAFGKLRYAYVKRSTSGQSHVMAVWTEDSFSLAKLAPTDGAEPGGSDAKSAPRLPGSRRVMSADVVGTPFGLYVYQAPGHSAEQAAAFYDAAMKASGWADVLPDWKGTGGEVIRMYSKDGTQVMLTAQPDPAGGATVSVAEASARPVAPLQDL